MEEREEKKGFFRRLFEGLTKTRNNIVSGIDAIFGGFSSIDDDFYEEIEEILITGDIGVRTTQAILDDLREKVQENGIRNPQECKDLLIESIRSQMDTGETDFTFEETRSVVLVIGVNGVGKTTSIGKLASKYKSEGKKVILAAADTFRAAAGEQLEEWAKRAGVDIISGQEGPDPGAVVYDAIHSAKARQADMLLVDTAGRLHNKKNLMNELGKINRIIDSEYPEAYRETLVVLDATTGQNALEQAKQFSEVAQITGIILTKMDGTAKGGIAVAIQSELGIPVKYIGVGEKIEDLQRFNSNDFVNALFDIPLETEGDRETGTDEGSAEESAIEAGREEEAAEEPEREAAAEEETEEEPEGEAAAEEETEEEPEGEEAAEEETAEESEGEEAPAEETEKEPEFHFHWESEEEEPEETPEKPKGRKFWDWLR